MTNEMIKAAVEVAIDRSKAYGRAWLLSNGKELKVVCTENMKNYLADEDNGRGFWVSAIYENGHIVEA